MLIMLPVMIAPPTTTLPVMSSASCSRDKVCRVLSHQNWSGSLSSRKCNDLTRNYLNGSIPPQWGSMKLVNISLLGNRLTGSIPEELANLSSLTTLTLEHNYFSGNLPSALGSLPKIEIMFLNSNNFTGELPETFAKLTTLKNFRISDNNFTGNISEFIFQNWTNLEELYMEGSGLSGPIPNISSLGNLKYIIISDLNGTEANFPELRNLSNLERLVLRSCNLIGELPEDSIRALKKLKILDVSFNRLSGNISSVSLAGRGDDFNHLILTGNNFTGPVPQWMRNTKKGIDLSFNNFSDTGLDSCQENGPNFFASIARNNNSGIVPCLATSSSKCSTKPYHSVRINCGGRAATNGTHYEDDSNNGGPSRFFKSQTNWAFSSTGFVLGDIENERYLWGNVDDDGLYANARLAPVSLTYYAFCLANTT
ncbi:hypothetical protein PTKIN_Ptkin14bG0187200 [Pterospermum kingtungense]